MEIRYNDKNNSVELEGYVNAIERLSRPIRSRAGQFVERICKGAFKRALERNDDVRLLLNHDWSRDLGGTKDGSLELTEDAIGLKARATVTDPETVEKARNGDLVGWSFGFQDRDVSRHDENGMAVRDVKDLDLFEVSILDRQKTPAYEGTLVSVRSEGEEQFLAAPLMIDEEIREETPVATPEPVIDYSRFDAMIKEMKGE